jgi:hypothetical protein
MISGMESRNLVGLDAPLSTMERSHHMTHRRSLGGATVALCDGSVRFVADTVDLLGVWRPLTTARGGRAGEASPGNDW